jgi:hypothetical protein
MLEIHKRIVVDENQKPVAVQIPFDEFQRIEEVIQGKRVIFIVETTR